jgi:hypothetical protein
MEINNPPPLRTYPAEIVEMSKSVDERTARYWWYAAERYGSCRRLNYPWKHFRSDNPPKIDKWVDENGGANVATDWIEYAFRDLDHDERTDIDRWDEQYYNERLQWKFVTREHLLRISLRVVGR